ncbi:MAG: polysaccharide deacetylase family protein [Thaumarchaeota archaeon]|nr:polysaccharide deacetylase family protein [Nitrososphaerota archaeon]
MKIIHLGTIATGTVIILGIVMVVPAFMQSDQPLLVLLSFSITDDRNLPVWCNQLSSVLKNNNVKAIVFVPGKIAQEHPECVSDLPNTVDIGSETYDYVSLTSIQDYATQLEEVERGKNAVDAAGKIESKVFKAPHETTDQNIYSLLSRSGILADFSYNNQYNKYYNGQFIKFNLTSYDGVYYSVDFFHSLPVSDPVLINFDNSTPIEQIDSFITHLKSPNVRFESATDLTGLELTKR